MTIRGMKNEVARLREQVAKATPAPTCDLFERIERYARVFELLERGEPIPHELCEPAKVAELAEWHRRFNEMRAEADGETDQEGR